ncbi:Hypothetical predicted protein [Podarcis lilfordi]|uniref:Uncharacterized protein n=1 Tax=Podarcis lilfordi TaxID=74358 RepID=A0AA35KVS1_9SAUR|nr:Hypothetical predicted protein [Podarcis lilfordi]
MECKRQGALNCSVAQGTIGGCFTLPNGQGSFYLFLPCRSKKACLCADNGPGFLRSVLFTNHCPIEPVVTPALLQNFPPVLSRLNGPCTRGLLRSKPHGAQWDPNSQSGSVRSVESSGDLFLPSVGSVSPIVFNGRSSPYKTPSSHPGHHRLASQLWPFIPTGVWANREAGRRNKRTDIARVSPAPAAGAATAPFGSTRRTGWWRYLKQPRLTPRLRGAASLLRPGPGRSESEGRRQSRRGSGGGGGGAAALSSQELDRQRERVRRPRRSPGWPRAARTQLGAPGF